MHGGRIAAVLFVLLVICPAFPATAAQEAPALTVQVSYGPGGGPERFRVDFEDALLLELKSRGCFQEVLTEKDTAGLLFLVTLEAPVEELHNSLSLAGSIRKEDEIGTSSTTTRIRVHADMEILLPGSGARFRSKRIQDEASYQPTYAWEDGSAEARDELILHFAGQVARFACKSRGKKLGKWIAEHGSEAVPVR